MARTFLRTTIFTSAGLLLWAADFLFTYVLVALACARGFANASVMGVNSVRLAVVMSTLVFGLGTAALGWRALQMLHARVGSQRFIGSLALASALIGFIAVLWNGFTAALPASCET